MQLFSDLLEQLYVKDGRFINIYNLNNYLFNILDHEDGTRTYNP